MNLEMNYEVYGVCLLPAPGNMINIVVGHKTASLTNIFSHAIIIMAAKFHWIFFNKHKYFESWYQAALEATWHWNVFSSCTTTASLIPLIYDWWDHPSGSNIVFQCLLCRGRWLNLTNREVLLFDMREVRQTCIFQWVVASVYTTLVRSKVRFTW